jgi:hypothetical protein
MREIPLGNGLNAKAFAIYYLPFMILFFSYVKSGFFMSLIAINGMRQYLHGSAWATKNRLPILRILSGGRRIR